MERETTSLGKLHDLPFGYLRFTKKSHRISKTWEGSEITDRRNAARWDWISHHEHIISAMSFVLYRGCLRDKMK